MTKREKNDEDNQRRGRNQTKRFRTKKIDKGRWKWNEQHSWPLLWVVGNSSGQRNLRGSGVMTWQND